MMFSAKEDSNTMSRFINGFLVFFSFIHRICPLCVISRKFPKSKFAKAIFLWGRIRPCCNIYFQAKRRDLIK